VLVAGVGHIGLPSANHPEQLIRFTALTFSLDKFVEGSSLRILIRDWQEWVLGVKPKNLPALDQVVDIFMPTDTVLIELVVK
jgi:hypothetical protein